MFNKIIQKWNAFKQDWKEYQRLCGIESRAWGKLEQVRWNIVVLYSVGAPIKEKCCIRTKWVEVPKVPFQDDWNQAPVVYLQESFCPHFKDSVPCSQISCPYHNCNHQYVAAAREWNVARAKCAAFWNNKSKTK